MRQGHPTRLIAVVLFVSLLCGRGFAGPLNKPSAKDRQVARIVSALMGQEHLSKRKLNDEIARRALKNFMRRLDPEKIYFLQQDHAEFKRVATSIDDNFRRGNIKLAYTITKRYLKRLNDRQALIHGLIDLKQDFAKNEFIVRDPDKQAYPADEKEAKERFRKRVKFQLMVLRNDKSVKKNQIRSKLHRRYESFAKRRNQLDSDEVLEMYLTAIPSSFD